MDRLGSRPSVSGVRPSLSALTCVLGSFALSFAACGEKAVPPPAAPEPPLVIAPLDGGVAPVKRAEESAPTKPRLTCPTPSVADALRSCASVAAGSPTMQDVLEAESKASSARLAPKGRATKPALTKPAASREAERLRPRPFAVDEERYLEIVHRYLCNTPGGANRSEMAYGEARQYFEAQHWEEAGALFHDVALGPPSDVAIYAAQLSLEAFNILSTTFNRPDCNETLVTDLDAYIARLCTPSKTTNAEPCRSLLEVRTELQKRPR